MGSEPTEFEQDESKSLPIVQIDLTPEFYRDIRDSNKCYPNIRNDLQSVIQDLEISDFVGDRIAGIGKGYVC